MLEQLDAMPVLVDDKTLIVNSNLKVSSNLTVGYNASVGCNLEVAHNVHSLNFLGNTLYCSNVYSIQSLNAVGVVTFYNPQFYYIVEPPDVGPPPPPNGAPNLSPGQFIWDPTRQYYMSSWASNTSRSALSTAVWASNAIPTQLTDEDNLDPLAVAGVALGAAGLLGALGQQLFNGAGDIGTGLKDELQDLLGDEDLPGDDDALLVDWRKITSVPLALETLGIGSEVGFTSDAYFSKSTKLLRAAPGEFEYNASRNNKYFNPPLVTEDIVIDFATKKAHFSDVTASNAGGAAVYGPSNIASSGGSFFVNNFSFTSNAGYDQIHTSQSDLRVHGVQ
ncbi:MAG: hypothetical protein ACRECQ_10920, partial [Burkholderiaceae bacterium]